MKKTLIIIYTLFLAGMIFSYSKVIKVSASGYTHYDGSVFDQSTTNNEMTYELFMEKQAQVYPNKTHVAVMDGYTYEGGLFEDDQPYFDIFLDDKDISKEGLYIPETGDTTLKIYVEEAGLYHISLDYFTIKGRGASINRGLKINDEYQYKESSSVTLARFWVDEFNVSEGRTKGIDDIRPRQIEKHLWSKKNVEDNMGYYNAPYYFRFEAGLNTITFVSQREPIVLAEVKIYQAPLIKTYEQYYNDHINAGGKVIEDDYRQVVQGEEALMKSSPALNPIAEFGTNKLTPYERYITRYNAIGGVNWRIPGDEITWAVAVEKSGFYLLSLKVIQNFSRGQNATRTLKVNGSIPFREAENLEFKYDSDLQYVTIGKENNLRIYLEAGENEISLQSTIGVYGSIVNKVNSDIQSLRSLYREIVMRTGLSPDPVQDYLLTKYIKDLNLKMTTLKNSLTDSREKVIQISKGRSQLVSVFDRTIYQLDKFLKDEKNIQKGLREFEQNISSLGSWVIQVSEQPLIIDELMVHGESVELPRVRINFFERIWHEIILFIGSFKDVGDFGSSQKVDGPTIEVWTGTGRDQTTIMRQLIDESFVQKNNINVKLKMVNMDILLSATLSGNGPDIAIGVDQKLPVNWGIRNAIKDLTEYDDFNEITHWFSESAMVPLTFDNHVYGLPDTEDFLVMFYREDILNGLGINDIPKTWDDVIDISPVLQKQYLDFYIPVVQGTLSTTLYAMIEQADGSLYINGGRESGLLEPESMEAFLKFTRFFTDYGFVLEANFMNRFRSGEMPIGIANYTLYNSLAVFAPEIQGQWDYGLLPGTINKDGVIDRSTTSSITSSIILKNTKYEDETWEFLKWWHSEDVQLDYARGMEAILGAAARYPTANLKAFSQLPWPAKDYVMLTNQRAYAKGIPTVPGDYIVGRHIDNAFRQVLNENIIPQDSLYQYHLKINEEIARKRKELGLD